MRKILVLMLCLALMPMAWAVTNSFTITATTTFTPLTLRFMAPVGATPAGSDANSGVDAAHPWATHNHAMNCGDVIIAAAGDYSSNNLSASGTVSNCPSVSGGIDGTGGVYFATLLCGGSDLESCTSSGQTLKITKSNWAVSGFKVTGNGTASRSFEADATASGTTLLHHVAFINNISYNSNQGYDTNDGGINHNIPGNGVDYFAVVGSIAQNSAQDSICLAAIDFVGPANSDALSGTHAFINGNFAWNNQVTCHSDGEGIMLDTMDAHGYTGQVVVSNNIVYSSARYGIQVFYQNFNSSAPVVLMHHNTLYGNDAFVSLGTPDFGSSHGDINIQSTVSTLPWLITIQNNISKTSVATWGANVSGGPVYAFLIGGNYTSTTVGGTGNENIFSGLATTCGSVCDAGKNVVAFNGGSFGTNTYTDPVFTNTTDLLTNRNVAPTCTGFENVTQCMGWDTVTATLTTPSIISDLVPTTGGMTTKGYQKPDQTCVAIASYSEFPVWLKGIVYLHWTGSIIQQRAGLTKVPCGY